MQGQEDPQIQAGVASTPLKPEQPETHAGDDDLSLDENLVDPQDMIPGLEALALDGDFDGNMNAEIFPGGASGVNEHKQQPFTMAHLIRDEQKMAGLQQNVECPGCQSLIYPNPRQGYQWESGKQCLDCKKASCGECSTQGPCQVCESSAGFTFALDPDFSSALEQLLISCPLCPGVALPFIEALVHQTQHVEGQTVGAPPLAYPNINSIQVNGLPSQPPNLVAPPKMNSADERRSLILIGKYMHIRGMIHYWELLHSFRELQAIIQPALDKKQTSVPLGEIRKVYTNIATYVTNKSKREKHTMQDLLSCNFTFDRSKQTPQQNKIDTELAAEARHLKKFVAECKVAAPKLRAKAFQHRKKPNVAQPKHQPAAAANQPAQQHVSAAKPSKLKNFFGFGKKDKQAPAQNPNSNLAATNPNPPKCMMGHSMNKEPITDFDKLVAAHKEIETMNKFMPGQLRNGAYSCDGPSCLNQPNPTQLGDFQAGWHMCSQKQDIICKVKLICHRCYLASGPPQQPSQGTGAEGGGPNGNGGLSGLGN